MTNLIRWRWYVFANMYELEKPAEHCLATREWVDEREDVLLELSQLDFLQVETPDDRHNG